MHSGGIIKHIRKGIIQKALKYFKLKYCQSIIQELIIDKVKYFLTSQKCFLKNLGRVAEWSALRTGNRGYPSSIPAKDKNFFFQRN